MWTVLNVLRRWFPVNWPKIENRIRLFLMRRKIAIVWPMRNLDRDRIITCHDPSWDYIRISNLELCAYEILHNDVAGDVAELGVFKGDFARKINEAFPEKKLYLFDTFEGFDQRDVAIETDRKIDTPDKSFPGSNVDLVMGKMPHPQNVRIQKVISPIRQQMLKKPVSVLSHSMLIYISRRSKDLNISTHGCQRVGTFSFMIFIHDIFRAAVSLSGNSSKPIMWRMSRYQTRVEV